jgi:hypothetical protein
MANERKSRISVVRSYVPSRKGIRDGGSIVPLILNSALHGGEVSFDPRRKDAQYPLNTRLTVRLCLGTLPKRKFLNLA